MLYLVVQMTVFLLLAAVIGFALGWRLRGARAVGGGGAEAGHDSVALERARTAARQNRAELAAASERLQQAEQELVERAGEVAALRERLAAGERREPVAAAPRPAKLAIAVDEALAEIVAGDPAEVEAPAAAAASDDLTAIRGIGKATAIVLRKLGYTSVEQIAAWGQADIDRVVAAKSALKGRIERDRWVAQAQAIAAKR